ncbi:unnamed protein product, partial [Staurois parvus]
MHYWVLSLRRTSTYPYRKTPLNTLVSILQGSPGLISVIYASLNSRSSSPPLSYVSQWERDLGVSIAVENWPGGWWRNVHSIQSLLRQPTKFSC